MNTTDDFGSIAIIGLSGRFPGAKNPESFWRNIAAGVESISPLSDGELLDAGVSPDLLKNPDYIKVASFLEDVDLFDPEFFGITPKEAELMNPQHRIFLECAWEALENAGYGNPNPDDRIGVFAGESLSNYSKFDLYSRSDPSTPARYLQSLVGNDRDYLVSYISYKLNLKGPSVGVQTACSTSLVAVCLACQCLLSYGADMALAGGITLRLPQKSGYLHEPGSIHSPDGHCRSFDARSRGTVFGSGAGIVVLKRLQDAIRDRDHIFAIIKGSAINNDGALKAGFTAPSVDGQADAISMAQAMAGVPVETIGYIEAHGTGTPIGDPIEIAALSQAFRANTEEKGFCAIGSVKTNVGHLESAAGIASLIKTVYALKHKLIPPSLHFEQSNPEIDFPNSPFYVNTRLSQWKRRGAPRRAGVSSFGIGGTNAHVVLEESPVVPVAESDGDRMPHLLTLSAKTEDALVELAERYLEYLETHPEVSPADICFTANAGRAHFEHRFAAIAESVERLRQQLDAYIAGKQMTGLLRGQVRNTQAVRVVFNAGSDTSPGHKQEVVVNLNSEADRPQALRKLGILYVNGADVDWLLFDRDHRRSRVALPVYPFQKKRYWLGTEDLGYRREPAPRQDIPTTGFPEIHPLIGRNTSTLNAQKFTTRFTGDEFYLKDHVVDDKMLMPGAIYLEMARAAGELAGEATVRKLKDIVWIRPMVLSKPQAQTGSENPRDVHIRLSLNQASVAYEITGGRTPLSRGKLVFEDADSESTSPAGSVTPIPDPPLDIEAIRKRLRKSLSREACYERFKKKGFAYGPGFQTIIKLDYNEVEALSCLNLPADRRERFKDFVLHPSLMDGALQTVFGVLEKRKTDGALLPFYLEELEIVRPLSERCYAYVRLNTGRQDHQRHNAFDILITDETGNLLVRMKHLFLRSFHQKTAEPPAPSSEASPLRYYRTVWEQAAVSLEKKDFHITEPLLILDEGDQVYEMIRKRVGEKARVIRVKPGQGFKEISNPSVRAGVTYEIHPGARGDYRLLAESIRKRNLIPTRILHMWLRDLFLTDQVALERQLERGFYSSVYLAQALMREKPEKKIRSLYVYPRNAGAPHPLYAALSGFAKTLYRENPQFISKVVGIDTTPTDASTFTQQLDLVLREFSPDFDGDTELRYQGKQRWVKKLQRPDSSEVTEEKRGGGVLSDLKERGVYLITGGAGALGLIFAEYLANRVKARLILTGRSELSRENELQLKALERLGSEVIYIPADVSKRDEVKRLILKSKSKFRELNGVIHAAGATRDAFVLKKNEEEIEAVLKSKIFGTVNLDEVTRNERLDFFVMFSSLVSVLGNPGQSDYAYANDFMSHFTETREGLRCRQERWGKTISIHWPYWQDGGMRIDEGSKALIREEMGMHAISTEDGIRIFEHALRAETPQVIAVKGDRRKIEKFLFPRAPLQPGGEVIEKDNRGSLTPEKGYDPGLKEKTELFLKGLVHQETGISVEKIDAKQLLELYGIDSLMILNLNRALEKHFGKLSKTLFFEYQRLSDLSEYFLRNHSEKLIEKVGGISGSPGKTLEREGKKGAFPPEDGPPQAASRFMSTAPDRKTAVEEDIAIIGVGGRYPMAANLEAFWENLKTGKDCITQIPGQRWDYRLFYDPDKEKKGKTYSKWGGFIEDVDRFDPIFFRISPREAELMDPQERLFLETAWETLEDAAYTRADLERASVGVFVGVMWGEYQLFGAAHGDEDALKPSASYASIANRVSYFFNFQGPSMALDTMCSSSLTAIHLACESLKRGESDVALAGGVNVSIHPNKFILLSQGKFASSDGRCRSFGADGDGYVPGEGVGAVLLKPLSKAISDNDRIYAKIKASSIKHGGKTNGYSVPNPKVQADTVGQAVRKAGIDPRMISYMEAHGTGTSLGDPIEIASLTAFFRQYTEARQFCAIGSIKSNIGHCESAAGIAGLTKVLLQLQHRQVAPSLHSGALNPNIDFNDTPFVVQQGLSEWKRPKIMINGETREYPRIAGISSFGAGGSYAHIVIEEYIEDRGHGAEGIEQRVERIEHEGPYLIVLSAKNEDRLKANARRLFEFLKKDDDLESQSSLVPRPSPIQLIDLAYTLQVGREAMEERLAVMAGSVHELQEKLEGFLNGREGIEDLYRGQVKRNEEILAMLEMDEDMDKTIDAWIEKGKYHKLLGFWTKGLAFDWNRLYGHIKPRRIALPTYPFARERYWVPTDTASVAAIHSPPPFVKRGLPYEDRSINRTVCFLKKEWEPCPAAPARIMDRTVAILTTHETKELATQVSSHFPSSIILDLDDLESQLRQPEQEWKKYDGCVDLTGCGRERNRSMDWMAWLQRLIEHGHKEGSMLLCVTKGLESYRNSAVNLTGAARVGLYRMLQSEYRHLQSRHMDADPSTQDSALAQQIASEFLTDAEESEICFRKGKRYGAFLLEYQKEDHRDRAIRFPDDHVLLITGGTRGLGYLCAQHFVKHYGVKRLVLTGRETIPPRDQWNFHKLQNSPISRKIQAIEALEAQGVKVQPLSVPLTDAHALRQRLIEIKGTMGPVGGIIHSAGIIDTENPAFIRKSMDGIKQVLDPKVAGVDRIYQIFQNEPLQFFVLFSSVSAIVPALSTGQSDYAMANAYMDYLAEAAVHTCPIVSIQWPSWKETGMGEVKSSAYRQTGLLSQTDAEGLTLLDHILHGKIGPVVLPAMVNPDLWKPRRLMQRTIGAAATTGERHPCSIDMFPSKNRDPLVEATQAWLSSLFSEELKLNHSKLDVETAFHDYGMDSVLLAQVITRMERELRIQGMEPAALIEYPTIKSLAGYLAQTHTEALTSLISAEVETDEITAQESRDHQIIFPVGLQEKRKEFPGNRASAHDNKIAVVGMACHFPDATNISEYWENLKSGKDSIREVPKSRWDWETYYGPNGYEDGKSVSKWGAFLAGIDEFDPGYFNMAESLAPRVDPLQRQWLEVSAEAMADAGYGRKDLWGKQVGVFAGARTGDFPHKFRFGRAEKDLVVGIGQNFISAHLAHIYNFKGPNMVIDTACSSALTAIHLAVQSIRNGETEIALAGGVDILLDESVFLSLSAAQILSPEGRCRPFDAGANGIGLGEGCGVLVLKPLKRAIRDHNKIYGVILGSAINNDGNTMGVTTPNPDAQRELIETAMADAGISPETIGYVETHGTGTLIGDPIELKALTSIFAEHTSLKQFCGVGSVKSNIGHLLSAAGSASIIKVLLAITHRHLPPTLHCSKPNPRFNFKESPLYPVLELKQWTNESHMLRAGISAFGLGGNNAHIIVSNEKIPASHQASLEPRGKRVRFNRKRYWAEEKEIEHKPGIQDELKPVTHQGATAADEEAFLEFFKPESVTMGSKYK